MTYDTVHNSLFLKVVWRGHLGVATAKSARTVSTGKESVSDKREFFRICGGFSPSFYNFQNVNSIYKLLFNWINSYV